MNRTLALGARILVAAAIGLVVGCSVAGAPTEPGSEPPASGAPASQPPTTEMPTPGADALTDLRYTCGTFPFDPAFLDLDGNAEQGDDPMAAVLREHLAKPGPDYDALPDTGWLLVGVNERTAELIGRDAGGSLVSIGLENRADGWKVTGWGTCQPQLVLQPGLGRADWLPDPDDPPPDAETVTFSARVTERACASGQPSIGRMVGPAFLFEPDRVLVAFAVRPLAGGIQTCQSNPATEVEIELGQPLGDRLLIDAGHLPHEDVRTVVPLF